MQHLADSGFAAFVRVGDHELASLPGPRWCRDQP